MSNPVRLLKVRSAEECSDSFSSFSSSNNSRSSTINGVKKGRDNCHAEFDNRIVIGAIEDNQLSSEQLDCSECVELQEKPRHYHAIQDTYTPQKVSDNSLKNQHGSFSTQRERVEYQAVQLEKVKANLFAAPSKDTRNKLSCDVLEFSQPNQALKNMQHKLNFKQKRQRGSITYTLPKIPSRMLTYDEQTDKKQKMQEEDPKFILLSKFRSQKVRRSSKIVAQDILQPTQQQDQIIFFEEQFLNKSSSINSASASSIMIGQQHMYDQQWENQNLDDSQSTETDEEAKQFYQIMEQRRRAVRAFGSRFLTVIYGSNQQKQQHN